MRISVFGSGYVGLVMAACFAEVGNQVICVDINEDKIAALQENKIPIYEPGLDAIVTKAQTEGNLHFTTDVAKAVKHGECIFIAVGTPSDPQGRADLSQVVAVANAIGDVMDDYTIIINKSTVPIGTALKVKALVSQKLQERNKTIPFDVVSNPEFLKEGVAIHDFRHPDRIVVGVENQAVALKLKKLYQPFFTDLNQLMVMDLATAELTKYAANAMLATKISFMNEMANLAEKVGADIEMVRLGIGADPRIGYHFTHPGCGYGGSCFGKDVQALIHTAKENQCGYELIQAVDAVNEKQKIILVDKIQAHFNHQLKDKVFAIWGLAFKPETNDMRFAPSVAVIDALLKQGAILQIYDPQALNEAKKHFGERENLFFCGSSMESIDSVDALVILTQWKEFKTFDLNILKLKTSLIFDGRNIYDPFLMATIGITYYGVGRGSQLSFSKVALNPDFDYQASV